MSRVRQACATFLCTLTVVMVACEKVVDDMEPYVRRPAKQKKDYSRPLAPGEMALRKIPPEEYPDFSRGFAHRAELETAVQNSLSYLAKPSSRRYFPYLDVSHERAVASLQEFLRVLRSAQSPEHFDQLIKSRFEVYQSKGYNGEGIVFFTGYYCPIFEGRRRPDSRFRYPLYRMPPDLIKDSEGRTLGRQLPDGRRTAYPDRRQIEQSGMLRGHEIAWLKDPFEAYVTTVQGSAKLRLEDGSLFELGYAANNGHEYAPIAQRMIEDGVMSEEQLSLQTMLRYFQQNPDKVQHYTWQNPRYVFFQELPGGPFGSLNVPVLPYRSIATDKEVYPRACLAFLDTRLPEASSGAVVQRDYAAFALDQDTGGAIRAAGRCDVYMGIGPSAEALAGRTGSEGYLYYIFVRPGGPVAAAPSQESTSARWSADYRGGSPDSFPTRAQR